MVKLQSLKFNCNCRKPKAGLFIEASKDLNIDLNNSVMIGDSQTDIEAGQNAGCSQVYLVDSNIPFALLNCVHKILGV